VTRSPVGIYATGLLLLLRDESYRKKIKNR